MNTSYNVHPGEILHEKRGVSADTALRFGKYFDTTPEFWLNLQNQFELRKAAHEAGWAITRFRRPVVGSVRRIVS